MSNIKKPDRVLNGEFVKIEVFHDQSLYTRPIGALYRIELEDEQVITFTKDELGEVLRLCYKELTRNVQEKV